MIKLKAPSFWKKKSLSSKALAPIGRVYSFVSSSRHKISRVKKVDVPVICVGNVTVGGTGKTPICLALAKEFENPFYLTRGYGGKLSGVMVDSAEHSFKDVGDEALLLSKVAPVVVNPNRVMGAKMAIEHGAKALIMDDGLQYPYLHKDISFLVIDGVVGTGNDRAIPAGPLRESLKSALSRATAVIIVGGDQVGIRKKLPESMPVLDGILRVKEDQAQDLFKKRVVAFAGIGRPDKFFTTLEKIGCEMIEVFPYPDHYTYQDKEIEMMIAKAKETGSVLVTTTKDVVRLPDRFRSDVYVLEVEFAFKDEEALRKVISDALKKRVEEKKKKKKNGKK